MDADEIVLLSHLLGDGCVLPRQPIHYTSADTANLRRRRRGRPTSIWHHATKNPSADIGGTRTYRPPISSRMVDAIRSRPGGTNSGSTTAEAGRSSCPTASSRCPSNRSPCSSATSGRPTARSACRDRSPRADRLRAGAAVLRVDESMSCRRCPATPPAPRHPESRINGGPRGTSPGVSPPNRWRGQPAFVSRADWCARCSRHAGARGATAPRRDCRAIRTWTRSRLRFATVIVDGVG